MEKIGDVIEKLRLSDFGYRLPHRVYISIDNARARLGKALQYFCGQDAKWLPEYEEVSEWLTDNKGKGLLLIGDCGRGKTLITTMILPILLQRLNRVVNIYDAPDLNTKTRDIFEKHIIVIDDLGTESTVEYGEKKIVFADLIDQAEKRGKLLIVTTNLSSDELSDKYGVKTIDRFFSCCRIIKFSGESLRK
ncbi:MAG: hypothetical protein IJR71_00480 [Prevotella sp.]|nr:hypothetical protein [Prevotella sp.]